MGGEAISGRARARCPPRSARRRRAGAAKRAQDLATPLKLRSRSADTSRMAPSREQGIWMLERLIAGAVRYGHDLAVVHLCAPPEADDPTLAARLGAVLRGADSLVRWEPGVYVALLPDTGADGVVVAGGGGGGGGGAAAPAAA